MAKKKLYPDEAVVFEVTSRTLWHCFPIGSVVEMVDTTYRHDDNDYVSLYCHGPHAGGQIGQHVLPESLRPLTPAAQALLDVLPLEYEE